MQVVGSARLPILFPPDEKVRTITFRVVRKLPYGCIVGASFLKRNASVLSFGHEGGFKPEPSSPWIPFLSQGGAPKLISRKQAKGWKNPPGDLMPCPEEHFAVVKPPMSVNEPVELQDPTHIPALGDSAWEDDGTLQWKLYNEEQVTVEGFVSLQIPAFVKGPQPQERQLVLITPTKSYDLEQGVNLGVARGVASVSYTHLTLPTICSV